MQIRLRSEQSQSTYGSTGAVHPDPADHGVGWSRNFRLVTLADFVVRMLADANTLGGEPYKVHRVYRKALS